MKTGVKKWIAGTLLSAMLLSDVFSFSSMKVNADWTGSVSVSALNVRSSATTSSAVLAVLAKGKEITIHSQVTNGDVVWYKISTTVNGKTVSGYVHSSYVKTTSSSTGTTGSTSTTVSSGSGYVKVDALNMRSGASTSYGILRCLSKNTTVTILGETDGWYKVQVGTTTGYVLGKYITVTSSGTTNSGSSDSSGTTTGNTGTSTTTGSGYVNAYALNMRSGPSTSNYVIRSLYENTTVTILGETDGWYKIQVGTTTGYVLGKYITVTSTGSTGSGSTDTGNSGATTTPAATSTGKVKVSALNVRSKASTSATILACITEGTVVTITGKTGTGSNLWYSINVTANGKTISGYVFAEYITVISTDTSDGNTGSDDTSDNTDDTNKDDTNTDDTNTGNSGNTDADDSDDQTTTEVKTGKVDTAALNFRTGPGTSYSSMGYLYDDNVVTILDEVTDSSGTLWYKVTAYSNGKNVTGYVCAEYIIIITTGDANNGQTTTDMETMLAQFPESYRSGLRNLLVQHPNWIFEPVNTGLEWSDVVQAESKFGVSTVNVTSMTSSTNFGLMSTQSGAYDWSTDTYTVKDGTNWYAASTELVAYYLDPRNYFDEEYIFGFQSQAYEESQTVEVLNTILKNSFMSGTYTETDPDTGKTYTKSYAETYMEAGKISGASPYFLATRTLGEVGYSGNSAVNGRHSLYPGFYNFYSIGASDGGDALTKGIVYAMQTDESTLRPWNTRYKAIVGGAIFNANNYINEGQNTPYFQRFNVVNEDKLYWHQYMTSIHGVASQASMVYSSYKKSGVLDEALVFYIPVYNNMPSTACTKPSSGNPNPYLKSLTLNSGNLTLTPSFSYDVFKYSVVVPNSVSSVTVSASSVSQFAKGVSGTGTYSLSVGYNTIKVVCTAGNGATQTYTISIYRQ